MNGSVFRNSLEKIHFSQEVRHKLVRRMVVDFVRRTGLLHNAVVNEKDSVAHGHGFRLVMRHIDDGDTKRFGNVLDFKAHGFPQFGIEIGKRLIQKEEIRFSHQRTGQSDTLLLPTGKLVGQAIGIPGEVNGFQNLVNPCPDLFSLHMFNLQRIGDVVKYIHMGPYSVRLKNHSDIALFRRKKCFSARNQFIINPDFTGRWNLKSGDHPQHCRFSASRRPEKCNKFPITKHFVKFFQYLRTAKAFRQIFYCDSRHFSFPSFHIIPSNGEFAFGQPVKHKVQDDHNHQNSECHCTRHRLAGKGPVLIKLEADCFCCAGVQQGGHG